MGELHEAEVWLTDNADLVVTIRASERDEQTETQLRERLFNAVHHRFAKADPDLYRAYVQSTQTGGLELIEGDPVVHSGHHYGVVLVHNGVPA